MTPTERSLVIGGLILTGSTAMTFHGAFIRHEPLWSTIFNATFLIFVWVFYIWAWRYHKKRRPKPMTEAELFAKGVHPDFPNGINMDDIKTELSKCPPPKHPSTNR